VAAPPVAPDAVPIPPAFYSAPQAADHWLGDAAIELARSAGLVLFPWQELAVRTILAEDADGSPAAFEVALIVARQNGKGAVLEAVCLAWLFLTDTPLVMWSAHEFKTAAEGFRRIRTLIMRAPHLAKRVEAIRTAAGSEAIELKSGQRLRFVARSKGSGRGFTGGKVILDEAYELDDQDIDALLPTLSTQPDAQVVYTSSAGMATSSKLRSVRDRGRKGGDPSLAYLEWGGTAVCESGCKHPLPGDDGADTCRLNDRAEWRAANPSLRTPGERGPGGIRESFIEKERRALSALGFARERLGVWDDPVGESPIPLPAWSLCADPDSSLASRPVLAIDCSPGLRSAAVAAAGWRGDKLAHVEVIRHEQGVEWVVEYVRGVYKRRKPSRVVLIGSAPARALKHELEAAGVPVEFLGDTDAAAACAAIQAEVASGQLRHLGDPILSDALAGSARRDVGDGGWTWRRKASSTDICPLVAVTSARWALGSVPIVPSRESALRSFG
jgi:hypothetical protein